MEHDIGLALFMVELIGRAQERHAETLRQFNVDRDTYGWRDPVADEPLLVGPNGEQYYRIADVVWTARGWEPYFPEDHKTTLAQMRRAKEQVCGSLLE